GACRTAQNNRKGTTIPREGLVRRVTPQSAPYVSQSHSLGDWAMRRVVHRTIVARSTESEVSQIHSKGMTTPAGRKTQSHAEATATWRPAICCANEKSGNVTVAEKRAFNKTAARKL